MSAPGEQVAIVGGGVVGCALAYELAARGVPSLLLEADDELALGASGGNSGILHTGFDSKPGELETELILRAARLREEWLTGLGVPLVRCGARLRAQGPEQRAALAQLADNAAGNGVEATLPSPEELHVPGEAVTDPAVFARALATRAVAGGATVRTGARVAALSSDPAGGVALELAGGERLQARAVANCAGVRADEVAALAGEQPFALYPRKGEFLVFEQPGAAPLREILLPLPSAAGKGVLVFPTVDGHVIAGPTARDRTDKADRSVEADAAELILERAQRAFPPLEGAEPIAAYAGLRPAGLGGANYVLARSATMPLVHAGGDPLDRALGRAGHRRAPRPHARRDGCDHARGAPRAPRRGALRGPRAMVAAGGTALTGGDAAVSEPLLLGIDEGTTAVKAALFDTRLQPIAEARRPVASTHPSPGWVEQDPLEVLAAVVEAVAEVLASSDASTPVLAGLAHQGESVLAWEAPEATPLTPIVVWQDKRQQQLLEGVDADAVARSGLPLDPYFSAGKLAWLLANDEAVAARRGSRHAAHGDRRRVPDRSARRPLCDRPLDRVAHPAAGPGRSRLGRAAAPSLRAEKVVAPRSRPHLRRARRAPQPAPGRGPCGSTRSSSISRPRSPVPARSPPASRRRPTAPGCSCSRARTDHAACRGCCRRSLGPARDGTVAHALDGGVFAAGALLEWLAGGLGLAPDPVRLAAEAAQVPDSAGVTLLPAIAGLGSPWWQPNARGVIAGLHGGVRPAHIARAALEAIAHRVADVVEAMACEVPIARLLVDGGLTNDEGLLQIQADTLGIDALGATSRHDRARRRAARGRGRRRARIAGAGRRPAAGGKTCRPAGERRRAWSRARALAALRRDGSRPLAQPSRAS